MINKYTGEVCRTPADYARAGLHPVHVCRRFQLSVRELLCELCAAAGVNPPVARPGRPPTVEMWRTYFRKTATISLTPIRQYRRLSA